jgi:hypothetical protein
MESTNEKKCVRCFRNNIHAISQTRTGRYCGTSCEEMEIGPAFTGHHVILSSEISSVSKSVDPLCVYCYKNIVKQRGQTCEGCKMYSKM